MMGCLPGRRTLWAALALATLAGAGCVKDESLFLLNPEGPPEVVAVFVDVEEEPDYDNDGEPGPTVGVYADLYAGHALAFGAHPDINNGNPVTPPIAEVTLDSPIRVIFDELLDGQTMEQFKCACWDPDDSGSLAAVDNCPAGGQLYSDSPDVNSCTGCPDSMDTPEDETGRCEDATQDGTPDDSVLKPGLATVSCDNSGFTTETSDEDSGDYQPSGSLVIPAFSTVDGLGPAFRFHPTFVFYPSEANCTLTMNANSTITDKDGVALAQTQIPFTTTSTYIAATTVANNAMNVTPASADNPTTPTTEVRNFDITFNGPVDGSPANLALVTMSCTGAGPTPGAATFNPAAPFRVRISTNPGYGVGRTCTVTIDSTFEDAWGNAAIVNLAMPGMDRVITFTTAATCPTGATCP